MGSNSLARNVSCETLFSRRCKTLGKLTLKLRRKGCKGFKIVALASPRIIFNIYTAFERERTFTIMAVDQCGNEYALC